MYSVTHFDINKNTGSKNLFATSLKNGETRKLLEDKESASIVGINKDNRYIALKNNQLYEIDFDGKNATQLSKLKGGLANPKISPDGKHILFTREVQLQSTQAKDKYKDLSKADAYIFEDLNYRHWDTWEDGKYSHVFYAPYENGKIGKAIDIMENEPYDCPQKPFGGAEDVVWSSDGKAILYVTKKKFGKDYATSTNTDIYKYDISSKTTVNLTEGMMGYDTHPAFNSKGNLLAFTSMAEDGYEADKNDIYLLDFQQNKKFNLTKDWDGTVGSFIWSNDGNRIYFLAVTNATEQVFEIKLQKDLSKNGAADIKQLTNGDWDITSIVGQVDKQLVVTKTDMNRAAELFTVDTKSGKLKQLSTVNDDHYSQIATSKIEKRWIKTTDGKDMLTWIIFPPDFDPNKKYPTLLYCQGGPQSAVSQFYSFRWNFQLMAAQGYIIVAPNRRGLPGFGVEWNKQISGDWGGQPMKDYLSAIDNVAQEAYVDKNRLGCIGASYGGYSAYMLAGIHEGRFKTFISHNGLFDLKSWYGSTEELFFANKDVGGPYWLDKQPESYAKFSPSDYVKNWNTPMLIYIGGKDYRVPMEQGLQAYQAAQLKGIKSRLVYFPEENHWVIKAQNALVWQREFFNWLEETL
ncbi:S9 family peptidase [Pseudoxanthomonas sp. SGD-10]|nr:S9 family peptidase [Pseudoxanthomonas sp. SGD-10]